MQRTTLVAALALAGLAVALLPGAQAAEIGIQPPPQCVVAPCCFAPCPPPCEECPPAAVACPDLAVSTTRLFAYLGPHAGAAVHRDCSVDAWEAGLECNVKAVPMRDTTLQRDVGPAGYSVDACTPNLDCTCPPMLSPLEVALAPLAPPVKVEPVVCVTDPCPPMLWCAERSIDGGVAAGVDVESSCEVTVGVIDGHRVCGFNGLEHHQVRQTVGLVTLVGNYCGLRVD